MAEQLESKVGEGSVGEENQSVNKFYVVGLPLQLPEYERERYPEYENIEKIGGTRASSPLQAVSYLLFRQLEERSARNIMAFLNRTNYTKNYSFEYENPEFVMEGNAKSTPHEVIIQRNMALAFEISKHLRINMDSNIDPRDYGFKDYRGRVLARNFLYNTADIILNGRREDSE